MSTIQTQCLVIGTGIAGLSAAAALGERGIETLVLSAAPEITECNTSWAQGGIVFESIPSGPDALARDIVTAGCGINHGPAVSQLVSMGPSLVRETLLDRAAVGFDREQSGRWSLTREGGHAEPRILHRGDETGRAIEDALIRHCRALPSVRFVPGTTAVNLLMTSYHAKDRSTLHEPARCFGAFVFDQASGRVYPILAPHTVLATGGLGQLYLHSTNSPRSRGDGLALAHRAGCRLMNLEYIQFHPTTFFREGSRRFLITEALRGEGGLLLNQAGDRFLTRYLGDLPVPELGPRDRVAKAIHQEMLSAGAPCVYLDISHRPAAWIQERFPFVYRTCLENGVDITREPIPVVPAAHYHCGGIWTDLEGRTSIPRLWAAGEVACTGLHGANRLASTSLLEGLIWGTRAGRAIGDALPAECGWRGPEIEPWHSETAVVDPSFLYQDWQTLRQTMWNYVGLVKTEARLARASGILRELARGIDVFYRKACLSDELIGLRHAVLVAVRIVRACERNPRSLGCYQREDLAI